MRSKVMLERAEEDQLEEVLLSLAPCSSDSERSLELPRSPPSA